MTTRAITNRGTFRPLWAVVAAGLAAGYLFAQVSPSETQTLPRKAVQPNPIAGQSVVANAPTQAVTKAVSEAPVEPGAGSGADSILHQIEVQATPGEAKTTGGNDLSERISNLEPTGQYIERDLRIPEGNHGGARFVRFLIPVYKEKVANEPADRGKPYR